MYFRLRIIAQFRILPTYENVMRVCVCVCVCVYIYIYIPTFNTERCANHVFLVLRGVRVILGALWSTCSVSKRSQSTYVVKSRFVAPSD